MEDKEKDINQVYPCDNYPPKKSHECFVLEFWTGINRDKFIGTKEEIHHQIDLFDWKGFEGLSSKK